MISSKKVFKNPVVCYHCGEVCESNEAVTDHDKSFCCAGCKTVFELLAENNLCTYYQLTDHPGNTIKTRNYGELYAILDREDVAASYYTFKDEKHMEVLFYLPGIHCSSCIYLLEKMNRICKGVAGTVVNFQRKEIRISADPSQVTLRGLAEMLHDLGYEPYLSLKDSDRKMAGIAVNRSHLYKIGIAGFCFGNIMMLSFPEYFSMGDYYDQNHFKEIFAWLNLSLSLPVLFYCSSGFFKSAWSAIRNKTLNIDAPIALAILITFLRSLYDLANGTGAGYFDSMTGIVFFMLTGRYFQNKTYDMISFERDYKSYFPLGVSVMESEKEIKIPLRELRKGQVIKLRNEELIPADAVILKGNSKVDYSFVTGESAPVIKTTGEILYAGGRHKGTSVFMEVINDVSHSYLTSLWNRQQNEEEKEAFNSSGDYVEKINLYFTYALLVIAMSTAAFWMINGNAETAFNALTTILIVACPCALLLSATFANGNIIQLMGKAGFYLKNPLALEKMVKADVIVFDKTGTLTREGESQVEYTGDILNKEELSLVYGLVNESSHPLSRTLSAYFEAQEIKPAVLSNFSEVPGKGLSGFYNENRIKAGSRDFTSSDLVLQNNTGSGVFVVIGKKQGYFHFRNVYRPQMKDLINKLSLNKELFLLSGDNESEKSKLSAWFGSDDNLYFNQSPRDKLNFIKYLQNSGKKVMMLGDGLNDAGALMEASAGIAVSDNINHFSPACDGIIEGPHLSRFTDFIQLAKDTRTIVYISFIFSVIYNIIGLYFALRGELKPVIAAILMPCSSITIVLITTLAGNLMATLRLKGLFKNELLKHD